MTVIFASSAHPSKSSSAPHCAKAWQSCHKHLTIWMANLCMQERFFAVHIYLCSRLIPFLLTWSWQYHIASNALDASRFFTAGTWRIGDFGSATFGTAQPTETTDAMWPGELESSERTDNIMMAHTLLLICGKVEWGKATLESLRSSAATATQALREILESLLV